METLFSHKTGYNEHNEAVFYYAPLKDTMVQDKSSINMQDITMTIDNIAQEIPFLIRANQGLLIKSSQPNPEGSYIELFGIDATHETLIQMLWDKVAKLEKQIQEPAKIHVNRADLEHLLEVQKYRTKRVKTYTVPTPGEIQKRCENNPEVEDTWAKVEAKLQAGCEICMTPADAEILFGSQPETKEQA